METSCSQFGFEAEHSCDIIFFEECDNFYVNAGSPVFTSLHDASEAFCRVTLLKLFYTFRSKGVPLNIVETLSYWYTTQEYLIQCGKSHSATFRDTNGIRQGGLFSPILYNSYICR